MCASIDGSWKDMGQDLIIKWNFFRSVPVKNMKQDILLPTHTVIHFVSISAKFGICTVVGLNETLVETKIRARDTWMCKY